MLPTNLGVPRPVPRAGAAEVLHGDSDGGWLGCRAAPARATRRSPASTANWDFETFRRWAGPKPLVAARSADRDSGLPLRIANLGGGREGAGRAMWAALC